MRLRMALVLCTAFLSCPLAALADQITLTNGDRISGSIEHSDAKALVVKTDWAGEVTVHWDAVAGITSSQALHLSLKDGQTIVGTVTTDGDKFSVATKDAGPVVAAKSDVVGIRDDSDQKSYDASIDRLRNPSLTDLWSGMLDAGLSLTRGSSSTVNFTLAAKAIRETPRDKITAYTNAVYGTDDSTTPSTTTANEIKGGIRADINLTPRVFVFGLTDFDSNALQHLDLQNDIGGGAGYHLYKTANMDFEAFGGLSYNQEYFSAYTLVNPTPPPPTEAFAALTNKNAEIMVGEELNGKLNGRTTVAENFTFYPGVSGAGGYRFVLTSNAATKIMNWLAWQITFNDSYLSNPPVGILSNDLVLSTGFRVTFGKATF